MLICWLFPILAGFSGTCDVPWYALPAPAVEAVDDEPAPTVRPDAPAAHDHGPRGVEEPAAPTTPEPDHTHPPASVAVTKPEVPDHWQALAECESGDWIDGGAAFVAGSARWEWAKPGTPVPPWGTTIHHGGLQFAPSTWEWVAGDLGLLADFPHAYDAPPSVQVQVGEEVQARQGWGAWPVCSRKVGLR